MENSHSYKANYSNYDPKNNPENKAISDKFERQVAEYYTKEGYNIWHRSASMNLQDRGIDLIAFKDDEVLFIQCKWRKNSAIDSLDKKVYDKMIDGYIAIKDNIIRKTDNAKYKLILACRQLNNPSNKSMVDDTLFYYLVRYTDDIEYMYPDIAEKQIIFFDDANDQLKLVRNERISKYEKEENEAKEKADAMTIVVFIYKCLESYEEILKSLENNQSNNAKEQRNILLINVENLENYYKGKKEKFIKILQEKIIKEIEQKMNDFFQRCSN